MYEKENRISTLSYIPVNSKLQMIHTDLELSVQVVDGVNQFFQHLSYFNGLLNKKDFIGLFHQVIGRQNKYTGYSLKDLYLSVG